MEYEFKPGTTMNYASYDPDLVAERLQMHTRWLKQIEKKHSAEQLNEMIQKSANHRFAVRDIPIVNFGDQYYSYRTLENFNSNMADFDEQANYGLTIARANFYDVFSFDKNRKFVTSNSTLSNQDLRLISIYQGYCYGIIFDGTLFDGANLYGCQMQNARARKASFRYANLSNCNMRGICATDVDFTGANLYGADLSRANLRDCNFTGAFLENVNFTGADLSGCTGFPSQSDFMAENFKAVPEGYIVYKTFDSSYEPNPLWQLKKGSIIKEAVNPDRSEQCGCGINAATLDWVISNTKVSRYSPVWRCLIPWAWLPGVVVPFNTDGKIRTEALILLEALTSRKVCNDAEFEALSDCELFIEGIKNANL